MGGPAGTHLSSCQRAVLKRIKIFSEMNAKEYDQELTCKNQPSTLPFRQSYSQLAINSWQAGWPLIRMEGLETELRPEGG